MVVAGCERALDRDDELAGWVWLDLAIRTASTKATTHERSASLPDDPAACLAAATTPIHPPAGMSLVSPVLLYPSLSGSP